MKHGQCHQQVGCEVYRAGEGIKVTQRKAKAPHIPPAVNFQLPGRGTGNLSEAGDLCSVSAKVNWDPLGSQTHIQFP